MHYAKNWAERNGLMCSNMMNFVTKNTIHVGRHVILFGQSKILHVLVHDGLFRHNGLGLGGPGADP